LEQTEGTDAGIKHCAQKKDPLFSEIVILMLTVNQFVLIFRITWVRECPL